MAVEKIKLGRPREYRYNLVMKSHLRGALVGALLLGAASSSFSLPLVWSKSVPDSTYPNLIRDSSSNLYFFTRQATMTGRRAQVQKYNAVGQLQWTYTVEFSGALDTQFSIRGAAVGGNRLAFVLQERNAGGSGTVSLSRAYIIDSTNGASQFSFTSNTSEFDRVAFGNGQFAFLQKDISTGEGQVSFYNTSGAGMGLVSLGIIGRMGDITMDTANNAYVGNANTDGTVQIAKCSGGGGVAFQTNFNSTLHNSELIDKVVYSSTDGIVYALGSGLFSGPNDIDVLAYAANASVGGTLFDTTVVGSTGDDYPGDISEVPGGGGVVVSGHNLVGNNTTMRRLSTLGSMVWQQTITPSPGGYYRSHAHDANGNLILLHPNTTFSYKVSRFSIANGTLLSDNAIFGGSNMLPLEIVADAAGNMYVCSQSGGNAVLQRIQIADLFFLNNNIQGGNTVQGVIELPEAATANQTWTIASSNTSAATVPATATVPNGSSIGTFTITAQAVASATNVGISARREGIILQKTLTIIPSALVSVAVSPNVVIGGVGTTGTVTLGGTAQAGGRTITLSSNKPAAATVPASVVVVAGGVSATFPVTTFGVATNQGVVVTATSGAVSKTAFFAVNAPSLTNMSVSPGSIKGGTNASVTVTINGIAPTGGLSITLISGAPGLVTLPGTISVLAGATSRNFTAPTAAVTATTAITLFSTRAGIYRTTTLTLTP